jgi:hypothetical protein
MHEGFNFSHLVFIELSVLLAGKVFRIFFRSFFFL